MMRGVLDLFLAQPFGKRSLLQRILSMTLGDDVKNLQKTIDALKLRLGDDILCEKLRIYLYMDEDLQVEIQDEAKADQVELIIAVLRSEIIEPPLNPNQITKVFNSYVAWNAAVEHGVSDNTLLLDAKFYSNLTQMMKLLRRQRDKNQMIELIFEGVTPLLFKEIFTAFYEPLARVYKAANVYNSVSDFSNFADDLIQVVEKAESDELGQDPNQLVQSFIDLCSRHEEKFYDFVHEVHIHDDGLFDKIMNWIDGILAFLRDGPNGKIDMEKVFFDVPALDKDAARGELDQLMAFTREHKKSNTYYYKLTLDGETSRCVRKWLRHLIGNRLNLTPGLMSLTLAFMKTTLQSYRRLTSITP